jgi:holo-[acyl-carrier protein] synthase
LSIRGVGTDIVGVGRFADLLDRYGRRFLDRCFRPEEVDYILSRGLSAPAAAAARWAAKEAFLKALGTDVKAIPYRDLEVVRSPEGPVSLQVHGRARKLVGGLPSCRWHLSISHERDFATATVILEDAQ